MPSAGSGSCFASWPRAMRRTRVFINQFLEMRIEPIRLSPLDHNGPIQAARHALIVNTHTASTANTQVHLGLCRGKRLRSVKEQEIRGVGILKYNSARSGRGDERS